MVTPRIKALKINSFPILIALLVDSGGMVGLVFPDFNKTFDSVLVNKIEKY